MGIFMDAKGRITEDDDDKSIEDWLKSTDQLIHGALPAPSRKEKRFDVWLDEYHQETIKRAREQYGATTAAIVIRTALFLLRMKLDQDAHAVEGDDND